MTTLDTRFHAQARVNADGTGLVTADGVDRQVTASTPDEARVQVLAIAIGIAHDRKEPIGLTSVDPDGTFTLIVHPEGAVTVAEAGPTPASDKQLPSPVPQLSDAEEASRIPEKQAPRSTPFTTNVEGAPVRWDLNQDSHLLVLGQNGSGYGIPEPMQEAPLVREPPRPTRFLPEPAAPTTRAEARKSFLTTSVVERPATLGWRGFLSRCGIRMKPSAFEFAIRMDEDLVSSHWAGPRTIAVVNGKGGASKTTASILLAAVFARYGGAGVLAWDNNQTRGTLGWRTEQGSHDGDLMSLIPQAQRLLGTGAQSADMSHFVHHQAKDKYDVLRSRPSSLANEQRFASDDVDAVHNVASKFYRIIIMDSGNDETDPMWREMIARADVIVVATTQQADRAETGALLLEELERAGGHAADLSRNAVVVVSQQDMNAKPAVVETVRAGFEGMGRTAVTIPYDPGMVDGPLKFDSLRPTTQRAWLGAAAQVAKGLA